MGRCLQHTKGKGLQRRCGVESDEIPGRGRRVYKVRNRESEKSCCSCRAFIWRCRDHGSRTHPQVTDLVYIAAFAPDKGESVSSLIANPPPGAPVPPILPPQDGYLFLDRAKFAASFAADVEPGTASFMADSQVPWGVDALSGAVSEPAWKTKPSYYLVTSDDKMIPPPAQRKMAERAKARVSEVAASHSVYVSKPSAVAEIIEKAAASSN